MRKITIVSKEIEVLQPRVNLTCDFCDEDQKPLFHSQEQTLSPRWTVQTETQNFGFLGIDIREVVTSKRLESRKYRAMICYDCVKQLNKSI